jgi:hypothetical protein
MTYTTEGYTFEVYSSGYVDWGLRVTRDSDGEVIFNSPCELCNESYGWNPPVCACSQPSEDGETECSECGAELPYERVEWTADEWREALAFIAEDYLPEGP